MEVVPGSTLIRVIVEGASRNKSEQKTYCKGERSTQRERDVAGRQIERWSER